MLELVESSFMSRMSLFSMKLAYYCSPSPLTPLALQATLPGGSLSLRPPRSFLLPPSLLGLITSSLPHLALMLTLRPSLHSKMLFILPCLLPSCLWPIAGGLPTTLAASLATPSTPPCPHNGPSNRLPSTLVWPLPPMLPSLPLCWLKLLLKPSKHHSISRRLRIPRFRFAPLALRPAMPSFPPIFPPFSRLSACLA